MSETKDEKYSKLSQAILKDFWGDDFSANIKIANEYLRRTIGSCLDLEQVRNPDGHQLGNDPEFIKNIFLKATKEIHDN